MKLTDLKPKWTTIGHWATDDPFYVGVSFLCPHCPRDPCPTCGHDRTQRLAVRFWPPIDPCGWLGKMAVPLPAEGHKRVSGDSFETLTLDPSVGCDPHWHGHIINGEIVP